MNIKYYYEFKDHLVALAYTQITGCFYTRRTCRSVIKCQVIDSTIGEAHMPAESNVKLLLPTLVGWHNLHL